MAGDYQVDDSPGAGDPSEEFNATEYANIRSNDNVYINNINNGAGIVAFAATRHITPDGVTDPGILATIKFTAIKQGGVSDLNLSNVVAANNNGLDIQPIDFIDDSVCTDENKQRR